MVTKARRDAKPKALQQREAAAEKATERARARKAQLDSIIITSVQPPQDNYTILQVVKALQLSNGITSVAARRLGCSGSTVLRYRYRYPEVEHACVLIKDSVLDLAEDKLIGHLEAGHPACVMFYLKTQGKARGYSERHEVSGPGGGPVPVKLDVVQTRAGILGDLRRIADRSGQGRVAQPALA